VLSANPYELRPEQLQTLSVRMTVVAGRVTFDAATQTSPASSQ
jgi:predicted amidohydrolase YtcJ